MDKIKAYMEHVLVKLPVPIKAKMEGNKNLNVTCPDRDLVRKYKTLKGKTCFCDNFLGIFLKHKRRVVLKLPFVA